MIDVKKRKSVGAVVGGTVLNVAALGGLLCVLAVIVALLFNVTMITFKTGSMSPTIPTGALAIVREIPASDVQVGDVVTVDRAGELPITHRVTSVKQGTGDERIITMKGDANSTPDAAPYTVSHVRLVIYSIPGLAYFLVWLSDPFVLGGIAVSVAGLVTWAFWPRRAESAPQGAAHHGRRRAVGIR